MKDDPGGAREGGCFCGRVRYAMTAEPVSSSICHCDSCRRSCGAQSVAWLAVPAASLSFTSGEPTEHRSSEDVVRTFCGGCGTSLTYKHGGDPDSIDVTTASLDFPDDFPPTHHTWLEDKLGWEGIDDGLARYPWGSSSGRVECQFRG